MATPSARDHSLYYMEIEEQGRVLKKILVKGERVEKEEVVERELEDEA